MTQTHNISNETMTRYLIEDIIEEFDECLKINKFCKIMKIKRDGKLTMKEIKQSYDDYEELQGIYQLEAARMSTREDLGMSWW